MAGLWNVNLIQLLTFYLGVMFLLSMYVRVNQYSAILGLVKSAGRWPRLRDVVKEHADIFLTWSTFLPAILALALCVINFTASRLLWPRVTLTPANLYEYWGLIPLILPLAIGMVAYDIYVTFLQIGEVDQAMLEGYFDQAETWLGGFNPSRLIVHPWRRLLGFFSPMGAAVLNMITRGGVRQRVAAEVRTALLDASQMLNASLWQVSVQVALRFACGLSIWISGAATPA